MKGSIVCLFLVISNCFLSLGDTTEPTAEDCQHHIDEAIKLFSEKHNLTISDVPTTETSLGNENGENVEQANNKDAVDSSEKTGKTPEEVSETGTTAENVNDIGTESSSEPFSEDAVSTTSEGENDALETKTTEVTTEETPTEPAAEPAADATAEPAADATAEPAADATAEPAADATAEPAAEATAEPAAEVIAEPAAESEPEPAMKIDPSTVEDSLLNAGQVSEASSEEVPLSEGSEAVQDEPELDIEEIPKAPDVLRSTDHLSQILALEEIPSEKMVNSSAKVLRDLKLLYTKSIKPMETLYKYNDMTTRHLDDTEIFSGPLMLVVGPWGSGKSTAINYLLGTEYTRFALRTGPEHKPGYFHILTAGEGEGEIVQGSQLLTDWRLSGLQKFGQSLLDKLKGTVLPHPFLKKVMIVEVPGVLESRVHDRSYPFNDVVQWFLDRADIVLVMFDPTKQDVGPEMEAILDQLKGRDHQVRYLLNKADSITPQDLMNVQASLLWTLSPVLGTKEPPTIYPVSLRSHVLRAGAPVKLLQHNEETVLKDIREALDKRVENRINHVRKHAVRVHNHAKMVDCYLGAYYKTKGIFSVKKKVAQDIAQNPHDYHIYDTISTITNVSRYDLPDPEVYRDFFKVHNLWEFPTIDSTCTYFGGCALDKLNQALAIDLPKIMQAYHQTQDNKEGI